jgi:hypothetical protein
MQAPGTVHIGILSWTMYAAGAGALAPGIWGSHTTGVLAMAQSRRITDPCSRFSQAVKPQAHGLHGLMDASSSWWGMRWGLLYLRISVVVLSTLHVTS